MGRRNRSARCGEDAPRPFAVRDLVAARGDERHKTCRGDLLYMSIYIAPMTALPAFSKKPCPRPVEQPLNSRTKLYAYDHIELI